MHLFQVKCDQYWPLTGHETYGLVRVSLIDEMELATYCVRTLMLAKVSQVTEVDSHKAEPEKPAIAGSQIQCVGLRTSVILYISVVLA